MDGGVPVLDLLVKTKLAPSRAEARRLIQQGGVSLDDAKVDSLDSKAMLDAFGKGFVILKKGKKVFHKVVLK